MCPEDRWGLAKRGSPNGGDAIEETVVAANRMPGDHYHQTQGGHYPLELTERGNAMKRLLALTVMAFAAGLVAVSTAAGADTLCTGPVDGGTFDNIVVPPGAFCRVNFAEVNGNVSALENSLLVIVDSNVRGSVVGDKADAVLVVGSFVRGDITITGGGPAPETLLEGFGCPLLSSSPLVFVSCEALVFQTIVDGNVKIANMVGSIGVGESRIRIGSLKIKDNIIPRGETLLAISGTMGLPVSKNVEVSNNTGDGDKFVSGVVAGAKIQCKDNSAPFSTIAPSEGGTNTAPKTKDQCS
jgi:hypothetical protein